MSSVHGLYVNVTLDLWIFLPHCWWRILRWTLGSITLILTTTKQNVLNDRLIEIQIYSRYLKNLLNWPWYNWLVENWLNWYLKAHTFCILNITIIFSAVEKSWALRHITMSTKEIAAKKPTALLLDQQEHVKCKSHNLHYYVQIL